MVALAKTGGASAARALRAALSDSDPAVRGTAATALGNLKVRDDALGGHPVRNVIVDHVSASWGLDENLSLYRHIAKGPDGKLKKLPVENLTIQWTISSEALDRYNHAFGGTWGGQNCSFHHNLFAWL